MILTATQINHRLSKGDIVIQPFHSEKLQPNGYDLHLSPTILKPRLGGIRAGFVDDEHDEMATFYNQGLKIWDVKKPIQYDEIEIPNEGFVLMPNELYIMSTVEYTESHNCIPVIEGKSSLARNGISVHQTAGFGEIGFCGNWTLEVSVIYPTRIYRGMPIAQIIFYEPCGSYETKYGEHGNHYQGQTKPTPTALWKNFESKCLDV